MRLYKESELLAFKQAVSPILLNWGDKWLSPESKLTVSGVSLFTNQKDIKVNNGLYIDISDCSLELLFTGQDITGSQKSNIAFNEIWSRANIDLNNLICGSSLVASNYSESLNDLSFFGSGSLSVTCNILDNIIRVVLSYELVKKLLSEPEYQPSEDSITKVTHAISNQNVNLTLTTNPLECDYLKVMDLKVGDILNIKHNVSEPMKVLLDSNKEVAKAFLARTGSIKTAVVEG